MANIRAFRFGPYQLVPERRALLSHGEELSVRSRAFDLLLVLVERHERVVGKDELMALVWPGRIVEEGNLTVHIAELRKLLGRGVIATLPGRGYRFVAPVEEAVSADSPAAPSPAVELAPSAVARADAASSAELPALSPVGLVANTVPRALTRLIGRTGDLDRLAVLLLTTQLITVVGPGGIGKTRLALALADRVRGRFPDGVWLIDLGPLMDPGLVPTAVASALGLEVRDSEVLPGITLFLSARRGLLIVDSCEHLLSAVAEAAEAILRACPGVTILATSREPLRAEGESLHRLQPLGMAPASAEITAGELGEYPASELFTERARAVLGEFAPSDAQAREVMEICRRLDGIPLAIELAVPGLEALPLAELRKRLESRFGLLTAGRRTALPRLQTLRATIGWSYDLLSEPERTLLRGIAIFVGSFGLEEADAVVSSRELASPDVVEGLLSLVIKSLVVAVSEESIARYRLLDTTRAYVLEKLIESGEHALLAHRHAEYYRDLLNRAEAESEMRRQSEWLAIYGRHIDDVRAAMDWAFSPDGDVQLGVALTIAAVPLWVQLSLFDECRQRVERALATIDPDAAATQRPRMQLSAALAWSMTYGVGRAGEAAPALATTLELAEKLDDRGYQLRALWELSINDQFNGRFRGSLDFAQRLADLTANSTDTVELMMGDRLLATALHYLGDQKNARRHIDRVSAHLEALVQQPQIVRLRFDMRVSHFEARILWLQGFADQALHVVERDIAEDRATGHALTFCSVLGQGACPVAYLAGDFDAAARYTAMLLDHTERHPVRLWHVWARCFNGVVMAKQGDIASGLAILRGGLEEAGEARSLPRFLLPLGELAANLGEAGGAAQGLAIVDEALARCRTRDEGWYVAELLRIKGELVVKEKGPKAVPDAEELFLSSLDWARRQDARSWGLRAATSLARMKLEQGQPEEAKRVLAPVYAQFTEGFETADPRAAKSLLDRLNELG
jgi:predicted ATPase/DNA-binding winged helix-turn-helix (wHTH) protein